MHHRHLFGFVFVLFCVVAAALVPRAEAYGEPVSSRPSYQERTVGALINAARVGPSGFAAAYMATAGYPASGIAEGLPAQLPLYFDPKLSKAASGHSQDLANNCHAVQFNSCDGTAWYTRVRNIYSCTGLVGEGLQYAYSGDPLTAVSDGVCGWNQDVSGNYVCCPASGKTSSGSTCNGLRNMYLSSSYSRFGVGYGADAQTGYYYWTTDYGACNTETYANPIASGSHLIQSGNVRFFAAFYDAVGAPQSAKVFVGGSPLDLALDAGTGNQGNYYAVSAAGSGCRSYYFQFTSASGGVYRLPETGYFNTFGEGSCSTDWTSTPVGGTVTTVPDPPQNVAVSGVTTSSATISWAAPATDGGSALTGYTVYIRAYGTEFPAEVTGGTSITFTGISPGTSCSVVVVAHNAVGSSANSTEATFITLVVTDPSPAASPSPSPAAPSPSATPSSTPPPGVSATPSSAPSQSPSPSASPASNGLPACNSASCLPASFDFHQQTGCFAGILDQGQCGSCYSFCVASANADRVCYAQGARPVLSPQEILDCGKGFVWFGATGCNGGDPYRAAQVVRDNGLPSASSTALSAGCRRYRCYNGNCDATPTCNSGCDDGSSAQKYRASSAYRVTGVDNTRLEIYNNGPVTAIFDVCQSFYDFYSDRNNAGKVWPGTCSSSASDYVGGHAIAVVGWGTDVNGVDYWLIENSWSTQWGDKGYYRMKRGVNQAGIEGYVSAAGFTRTNKRFGGVSAAAADSGTPNTRAGAPGTAPTDHPVTLRSSQYALELWHFNAHKDDYAGKSLALPTTNNNATTKRQSAAAAQPVGSLTTHSGFAVSSVNQATLQVTSGQSVFVDFVATNGAETVNLVATVSYGAAGGAASAAGVSVASAGGGAVLSTGAIIGIAVGGAVAVVLLAGVTAAVVVGAVAVYKKRQAHEAFNYGDHAVEMEAQGGGMAAAPAPAEERKAKRSTWFERRKLFQSITGRSPPVRVDN